MLFRTLILSIAIVVAACSNQTPTPTQPTQSTATEQSVQQPVNNSSATRQPVEQKTKDAAIPPGFKHAYLLPVQFDQDKVAPNVLNECTLDVSTQTALIDNAREQQIFLEPIQGSAREQGKAYIEVTYTKIEANRWSGVTFRPASTAYFTVTLYRDGESISSAEKGISSKVSIQACSRLDKISQAAAKFAADWLDWEL